MVRKRPPPPEAVSLGRPFCRCGKCWTGIIAIDPRAALFAMTRLGEEEGRRHIEEQSLFAWLKGNCPNAGIGA